MIVLLGICGNVYEDEEQRKRNAQAVKMLKEDAPPSWRERLAPHIINPMNSKKMAWDLIIGLLYAVMYFLEPYIFAFWQRPMA